MNDALVDIQGLVLHHAPQTSSRRAVSAARILNGVDLRIAPGTYHFVVGESGSGKSTLLNAIVGEERASPGVIGGSIEIAGETVLDVGANGRASRAVSKRLRVLDRLSAGGWFGVVFQHHRVFLNPDMRVGRLLSDNPLGRIPDDAERWTRALGLTESREQYEGLMRTFPHELSGGQKIRVGLVLALVGRPQLVLADEPTTGLDWKTRQDVVRYFCEFVKLAEEQVEVSRARSMVFVTHDLEFVRALTAVLLSETAERVQPIVHVMYAGRIVEVRPVGEWFVSPQHPYSRDYLSAFERRHNDRVATLKYSPHAPESYPAGCPYRLRCLEYETLDGSTRAKCEVRIPGSSPVACWAVMENPKRDQRRPKGRDVPLETTSASKPRVRGTDVAVVELDRVVIQRGNSSRRFSVRAGMESPVVFNTHEIVVLVGTSGAGKTTLLHAMAGMVPIASGRTTLFGNERKPWTILPGRPLIWTPDLLRRMQFVFQESGIAYNPQFTVYEALSEALTNLHPTPKKEAIDLIELILDRIGLHRVKLHTQLWSLSGGELKRVLLSRAVLALGWRDGAIGRSLTTSPKVLFVDELTTGYDAVHEHKVVEFFLDVIRELSITIVLASHNMRLVSFFREDRARIFELQPLSHGLSVLREEE